MSKEKKEQKKVSTSLQDKESVGFFAYWLDKTKKFFKKAVRFLLNPHLLICFGIAWMITNGWCYVFMAVGGWLEIGWMAAVGAGYAAFLWIPFTPEKLVTVVISIFLLRIIFPNDEKTLKVLKDDLEILKSKFRSKKAARKEKKVQKAQNEK